MRPKKKGRKKTLDIKEFKKPSNPIEVKSVDTSAEHVKELEDELLKLRMKCIFKKIEEIAFRGGNSSGKTANRPSSREQFNNERHSHDSWFSKKLNNIYVWQKRFDRKS